MYLLIRYFYFWKGSHFWKDLHFWKRLIFFEIPVLRFKGPFKHPVVYDPAAGAFLPEKQTPLEFWGMCTDSDDADDGNGGDPTTAMHHSHQQAGTHRNQISCLEDPPSDFSGIRGTSGSQTTNNNNKFS